MLIWFLHTILCSLLLATIWLFHAKSGDSTKVLSFSSRLLCHHTWVITFNARRGELFAAADKLATLSLAIEPTNLVSRLSREKYKVQELQLNYADFLGNDDSVNTFEGSWKNLMWLIWTINMYLIWRPCSRGARIWVMYTWTVDIVSTSLAMDTWAEI